MSVVNSPIRLLVCWLNAFFGCARYGTIPVVRKTGGLNDTVFDVDDDVARAAANGMVPNGYNFEGTDPAGIDYALNRCEHAFRFADSSS